MECPEFVKIGSKTDTPDRVALYLLFANGFDGALAWSAVPTPIRVEIRIAEARRVMGLTLKTFEESGTVYTAMSARQLTAQGLRTYLEAVVPLTLASKTPTPEQLNDAQTRQASIHAAIIRCFEVGRGSDLASARGTLWGAYNAVAESADHVYPVLQSGEVSRTRLASVAFGTYAEFKRRALSEAVAVLR